MYYTYLRVGRVTTSFLRRHDNDGRPCPAEKKRKMGIRKEIKKKNDMKKKYIYIYIYIKGHIYKKKIQKKIRVCNTYILAPSRQRHGTLPARSGYIM